LTNFKQADTTRIFNHIALVNRRSPYSGSCAQESLDFAMAMSNFGQEVSVFFIDDGVFQLLTEQQPNTIARKNFTKGFGALHFYDIDNIYACAESLEKRGLQAVKLNVSVNIVTNNEISKLLSSHKQVVTF
jgi:tRNA 2-thiouridine synthesizing protein C